MRVTPLVGRRRLHYPQGGVTATAAFVGRADELELLAAVIRRGAGGEPAAALVTGDPGSGKTRLLTEAVSRAGVEHRFRVVGYEAAHQVPLAAVSGLLRALAEVPEHGDRLDALAFAPAQAQPAALDPIRVFEAAHRALGTLEPSLVVLDDLQWVDDLSLALCEYLLRAAADSDQRLSVLAASRPSFNASVFGGALARALPPERMALVPLGGLDVEDGVALVRELDADTDAATARRMWEQAAGFPFWLEVLARSGGDEADAAQLVTGRVRAASSDATELLALLAVAARPLSLMGAATLERWPLERAERAALELAQRGIAVVETGGVRPAHDLIRAAAAQSVADDTRRRLHRRLAEQLEDEAGDHVQLLRQALEHRRAGGLPTLGLASRLARSPRRTLLGGEGVELLARIADEAEPSDDAVLVLNRDVAALASDLGLHQLALERRLLLADHETDPLRRAVALLEAAKASYELGRPEEAKGYLARARATDVADDALALDLDVQRAAIELWLEQRTAEGRALAEDVRVRARALIERAGAVGALDERARRAYVAALRAAHEAAMQAEDLDGMLEAAEEWAAAARGWDEDAYLTASVRSGVSLGFMVRLREAEERVRHVWVEAHRRVLPRPMLDAGYWLGRFLQEQGRLVETEEIAQEVEELALRMGDVPRGRNRISRLTCGVALHRGDTDEGLRRLARVAAEEPNVHMQIGLHQDLALWYARLRGARGAAEVVAQLGDARRCAESAACPRCSAELMLMSAEALARVRRDDDARASLAAWDTAQTRPKPNEPFLRRRLLGLLQVREGGVTAGVAELEAAREEADHLHLVVEALWTRLDIGLALVDSDRRRAADTLRDAAALASDLGARTQQDLAEQRLRALGVRTWRRGPSPPNGDALAPLSERELEVARLAASGASNPEIAAALFLSRKTVERHVSNALAKVGARNRAELAAKLGRLGFGEGASPPTEGVPR